MTFHPFVIAYGKRRGYAISDLDQIGREHLFTSTMNSGDQPPANTSSSNFKIASDLTLSLMDLSTYLKELNLFAAFFNSLPVTIRLRLRSYVDGMIAYFTGKLSNSGQDTSDITAAAAEFNFGKEEGIGRHDSSVDDSSDIGQLLKRFLAEFKTPFIYEYLRMQTDIFYATDVDAQDSDAATLDKGNCKDDSDSEKEDGDVDDPHWWKPHPTIQTNDIEDGSEEVEVESMLREIRDACSKLPKPEYDSDLFPYSIKIYNFSTANSTRGRPKPAAVCADASSDGTLACFGCDGDSSIRCFQLRGSKPMMADGATFRASSTSGTIYRLGFMENTSMLLATSDDASCPVQLFDADAGMKIYDYHGHRWPVWALDTTSTGGGMFVSGSYDRSARLFLLDRKDPIRIFVGHESSVDCVQFVQSQSTEYPTYIATASSDRTVRIWSVNDAVAVRVFHGMKGTPTALACRCVENMEKLMACATTEGKIFVWELETSRQFQILDGVLANDMQFSVDGRYLAVGGNSGCFKIYQLNDGGTEYVEIRWPENLLINMDSSKFLKLKFVQNELLCFSC